MNHTKTSEIIWLALSVLALLFAGIFAIGVAAPRVPFLHPFMEPLPFYRSIVTHVDFSMVIWIQTFIIGIWCLYCPWKSCAVDNVAPKLVLISILCIAAVGFIDLGVPYLNDYVPVVQHPVFWMGMILFWLAFFSYVFKFFSKIKIMLAGNTEQNLVGYSLILSLFIFIGLVSSFAIFRPESDDLKFHFQRVFWISGHIQQFLNACILLVGWHFLVRKSNEDKIIFQNNAWLKVANGLLLAFSLPILSGIFIDPLDRSFRIFTTICYGVGLGIPVMIHTVYLLKRLRFNGFAAMTFLLSMSLYYAGTTIAYMGMKSDLRITAHYHGVVSSLTVALMGMTYYMLKERNLLAFEKMAKMQPLIYTLGMWVVVAGLYLAGNMGAPRKTFGFNWTVSDTVLSHLNLMGIGAALAMMGGVMFVVYAIASVLKSFSFRKISLDTTAVMLFFLLTSFNLPEEQKFLGKKIADIQVLTMDGKKKSIYDLLNGKKPVVLSPIYTRCPSSCSLISGGLKETVDKLGTLGKDFSVITFSFDYKDTEKDLLSFKKRWKIDGEHWNIVSADEGSVKQLLASVDFQVDKDRVTNEFLHPNMVIVLTPTGKVSRYIYGISPSKKDLKLSLLEAKQEKTSLGIWDGFFLKCFRFDPLNKTYNIDWAFLIQVSGGIFVIGGMIVYFFLLVIQKSGKTISLTINS